MTGGAMMRTSIRRGGSCTRPGFAHLLLHFAPFHFFRELWQDCERIAYDTIIGQREDGCLLVLVDCDDIFRAFHSRNMLDCSTDATSNIERWFDRLACLTDLVTIREPASID